MAVSTNAKVIQPVSGYGQGPAHQAMDPGPVSSPMPVFLFGNGTPNTGEPFDGAGVGSQYTEVNASANTALIWVKVADTNAIADWVVSLVENHAKIDTSDLASAAGVTVEQLESNARQVTQIWNNEGANFDISASDLDVPIFHAVAEILIVELGLLWMEATTASGGNEGDCKIGVASGGAEIVTEANGQYDNSKALGSYQALTITDGQVVAGETVWCSHDQATSAGEYVIVAKFGLVS